MTLRSPSARGTAAWLVLGLAFASPATATALQDDLLVPGASPRKVRPIGGPQFTAFPTLGVAPHTVAFEQLAARVFSSWSWDFGDGSTSTLANPVHTYVSVGTYDVHLTGIDPRGNATRTKLGFVSVVAPTGSPSPAFTLETTRLPSTNPAVNPIVEVYDLNLNLVHTYEDPLPGYAFAELSKPLSNGRLLALVYDRQTGRKQAVELSANGTVLWQYDPFPESPAADIERLDNGNTLVVVYATESWPSIHADPISNEYVIEVDPNGNEVWRWGAAQNWDQLPLSASERAYLHAFPGPPNVTKWIFHTNSMGTLPANPWEGDDPRFARGNVLVSMRDTSKVFLIERPSGRVVWHYDRAHGQHHPRMIPAGLPGAGNILMFDNGGSAKTPPFVRPYSRLIEIDPTTNKIVWSYVDPATFYSLHMGTVQRLPNGNTFFNEGTNGVLKEIDPNGVVLWSRTRPAPVRIFRAYRPGLDWTSPSFRFEW